ncbi:MAG: hypothetical protein JWP11_1500, partial [Frankiales bacterium]|nr:hypothetical protein [Frankiales bacterium]
MVDASPSQATATRRAVAQAAVHPRHPNEVDWWSQGRSWPSLKHAYTILWRRAVLAGDATPVRSARTMALVLHCSLGTTPQRTARLEAMGLLTVETGS